MPLGSQNGLSEFSRTTTTTTTTTQKHATPTPTSFQEAIQQKADIEKKLQEFGRRAKEEMEEALHTGDDETIQAADYKWRIATSNIDDIRELDQFLNSINEASLVDQIIYGEEVEKRRRTSEKESAARRCDKMWRTLEEYYPPQRGQGFLKPLVWQKPHGWIQE